MSRHEPFAFKSSDELLKKSEELGVVLPFQGSISPLFESFKIGSKRIANRIAVQPMEGCDAEPNGSPGELTFRRYRRYAEGGSGLIWFEATGVVPEGRSNPRQLLMGAQSLDGFKRLVEMTRRSALKMFGGAHEVFLVLQLTHSGRYSKPEGKPKPQAACFNPFLDRQRDNLYLLSDEELDSLQDGYLEAARLAGRAGFDAVDIKACHGYLVNELLAAHTREKSKYGGSFEKRSRFLAEVIQKIKGGIPGLSPAIRLNAYDGLPFPYGFGVSKDDAAGLDLSEPKELVRRLIELGCSILNITAGNPYASPHLGRPFDRPLAQSSLPEEHPLEGISRLLKLTRDFKKITPDVPFVGTGYSWLRHFLPYVGASVLARGQATLIGLGRSSFAYPDAAKDLMSKGAMEPGKVCLTCSRCSELMRAGHVTGCAVRDREIYSKEYRRLLAKDKK